MTPAGLVPSIEIDDPKNWIRKASEIDGKTLTVRNRAVSLTGMRARVTGKVVARWWGACAAGMLRALPDERLTHRSQYPPSQSTANRG
jgi:hypothetical protein